MRLPSVDKAWLWYSIDAVLSSRAASAAPRAHRQALVAPCVSLRIECVFAIPRGVALVEAGPPARDQSTSAMMPTPDTHFCLAESSHLDAYVCLFLLLLAGTHRPQTLNYHSSKKETMIVVTYPLYTRTSVYLFIEPSVD